MGRSAQASLWSVVSVAADDDAARPGFAYTTGLIAFGQPELVVVGLGESHARRVLAELADCVRRGGVLRAGDELVCLSITPTSLRLVPVECGGALVPQPALQVMYADFLGTFPCESGYRYPEWLQQLPEYSAA